MWLKVSDIVSWRGCVSWQMSFLCRLWCQRSWGGEQLTQNVPENKEKLPSAENFKQQKYSRAVRRSVAFTQPLISTTEMHTSAYVLAGKAELA